MFKKSFTLITVLIILTILVFLGLFLINFLTSELKISTFQKGGTQALYLAEAGVEEAIWKIKNDDTFKVPFENGTLNTSFSRSPALFSQGSYQVQLQSIGETEEAKKGKAQIISTSSFTVGLKTLKRAIKVKVLRPPSPPPEQWSQALYGAEDIEFFACQNTNIYGNLFAADDIWAWGLSNVWVRKLGDGTGGNVSAMDQIKIWPFSNLTAEGEIHSQNINPPPPAQILMPQIDFDSQDPNDGKQSYLEMAQSEEEASQVKHVFTEQEFRELLQSTENVPEPAVLSGVNYVKGIIDIKRRQKLIVNGALVADGNIQVGLTGTGIGYAFLTINQNPDPNRPSGLLTKTKIKIGLRVASWGSDSLNLNGLLYAIDELHIYNIEKPVNIQGGLISREANIYNLGTYPLTISYSNSFIQPALPPNPPIVPVVKIEYWEEEY